MKFEPKEITLKNGKTVLLREAMTEDAQELIDAEKIYLRESDYMLSYEEEFTNTIEDEIAWIKSMDNDNSLLLIATHKGEILSTLSLHNRRFKKLEHTAEIAIAILNEWQGVGLGTALFEATIAWCKEKTSLEIICLDAFAENIVAYGLYQKVGFTEDGRKRNYFKDRDGNYQDNVSMSLNLL